MGVRIGLAGTLALAGPRGVVGEQQLGGRQPTLAFALLVLERHRPVLRDELADLLWADRPPASWEIALRGVIARVRGCLAAAGVDDPATLTTREYRYTLSLPSAEVDVETAERLAELAARAHAAGEHAAATGHALGAAVIAERPLLAGFDAPWLELQRIRLRRCLARSLQVAARSALSGHDPEAAVPAAERLVAAEPLDESGHQLLIAAHAAAGNAAAARRAYERCRALLIDELGVAPSARTVAALRSGPDELPVAVGEARRVGRAAREAGQLRRATRHYAVAVEALRPDAAADPLRLAELLVELALSARLSGEVTLARHALDEAAVLARRGPGPAALGRVAVAAAGPERISPRAVAGPDALVDEALAALGDEPSELRTRLLARQAQYLAVQGRVCELDETVRQARQAASAQPTDENVAEALVARLHSLWAPAQAGERLAVAGELLGQARAAIPAATTLFALEQRVHALLELGEWSAGTAAMRDYADAAARSGAPHARWFAAQHAVCTAVALGRLQDVDRLVDDVVAAGRRAAEATVAAACGVMHLVVPHWMQGRLAGLREPAEAIGHRLGWPARSHAALALIDAATGAVRDGLRRLDAALTAGVPERDPSWPSTMFYLTTACARLRSAEHGATLHRLLLPVAGRDCSYLGFVYYGSYALHLGVLAAVSGRDEEAVAQLRFAVDHHDAAEHRPWAAISRRELARALRALDTGEGVDEARRLDAEATDIERTTGSVVPGA